jgi:hypothetical protein
LPPAPAGTHRLHLAINVDAEGIVDVKGSIGSGPAKKLTLQAKTPTLRVEPTSPNLLNDPSGSIPLSKSGVQGTTAKPGLLQRLFKR